MPLSLEFQPFVTFSGSNRPQCERKAHKTIYQNNLILLSIKKESEEL